MKIALCFALLLGSLPPAMAADAFRSIAVGATPESVVPGFGGKLHVTLMGPKREKGDGDGKVVVVDGDRLITADFDKVWAIDAKGAKTLLAGPEAFPEPPRYLNDVVVEAGGRSLLITDMGDLPAMHSGPGVMWPLESAEAKKLVPRGRIYRMTLDGKVSVAIDHAPEMPNPNGVDALPDGTILAAEFFRGTLLEWKAGKWRTISSDHRSADGIAHDDAGNLWLTEVRTGRVWHVKAASGEKRLLATLESAADLYFDSGKRELVVPDSKAGKLVFIPVGN